MTTAGVSGVISGAGSLTVAIRQAMAVSVVYAGAGELDAAATIAGATSAEQVKANAAAADWTPTEAERAEIDAIVPPPPPPVQ